MKVPHFMNLALIPFPTHIQHIHFTLDLMNTDFMKNPDFCKLVFEVGLQYVNMQCIKQEKLK